MSVWAKSWAYEQTTGSPGRKAVLVALAEFADFEGKCRPGQKTLAQMTELEDRTVRRHLAKLEEDGFIERTERRRRDGTRSSDETRLLAPPERLVPPEKKQPDNLTGSEASTGQKRQDNRTKSTHQPVNMSGPLLNEPSEEPSEEPVVGRESVETPMLPDDTTTTCLKILLNVQGFPRDQADNALKLSEYREDFPSADPVEVCQDFAAYISERPFKKGDKPRLRLRNFFKQADKYRLPQTNGNPNGHRPPGTTEAIRGKEGAARRQEGYEWLFK